jgi:myo-inositol-1(or 4)-monophosphatase
VRRDHPSLPVSPHGLDALEVAQRVAREAGALVREAAKVARPASNKGRTNLVTATDRASEALIIGALSEAFPAHGILAEESRADADWQHGYVWVIDPIDGTRNFVSGVPLYCVNLALFLDGEPVLGVTYDLNRDWCIGGGPGLGVRANEVPVHASKARDLASSVIVADLGYQDARANLMLDTVQAMLQEIQAVRIIGSAALGLAWAAAGVSDLTMHSLIYPWDIAAALALVPAAGGVILDRAGGPARLDSEGIVAGSPAVVSEFFERFGGRPWR